MVKGKRQNQRKNREADELRRRRWQKKKELLQSQGLLPCGRTISHSCRLEQEYEVELARERWHKENPGKEPPWLDFTS